MKRRPICWIFAVQMRNPLQIVDWSVYRLTVASGWLFHTPKTHVFFKIENYIQKGIPSIIAITTASPHSCCSSCTGSDDGRMLASRWTVVVFRPHSSSLLSPSVSTQHDSGPNACRSEKTPPSAPSRKNWQLITTSKVPRPCDLLISPSLLPSRSHSGFY